MTTYKNGHSWGKPITTNLLQLQVKFLHQFFSNSCHLHWPFSFPELLEQGKLIILTISTNLNFLKNTLKVVYYKYLQGNSCPVPWCFWSPMSIPLYNLEITAIPNFSFSLVLPHFSHLLHVALELFLNSKIMYLTNQYFSCTLRFFPENIFNSESPSPSPQY